MTTSYLDPFIETLPREALGQIQLKKLQIALEPILQGNAFYKEKFLGMGVNSPLIKWLFPALTPR